MVTTLVLVSVALAPAFTFNTPIPIGTVKIDSDPAMSLEFSSFDPATSSKFISAALTGPHTFTVSLDPSNISGLTPGIVATGMISFIDYKPYFSAEMDLIYDGSTIIGTGTFTA